MNLKPVSDEDFQQAVREAEGPVVVMFGASWCKPCQNFKPTVEDLARSLDGDVQFVMADLDESELTASQLGIRSVPSLALFSDGMIRDVLAGTKSKLDVRQWINDNV